VVFARLHRRREGECRCGGDVIQGLGGEEDEGEAGRGHGHGTRVGSLVALYRLHVQRAIQPTIGLQRVAQ